MEVITAILGGTLENLFAFGIMVVVTLAIVIMIHEWGHYIAARLCGVFVEEYSFGFGKELISFIGKNKTKYSIRLFPIGGYVKLFGDVDKNNPVIWDHKNNCERRISTKELETAFCTKSVWQRMFIIAAGPLINIFFTITVLVALFTTYGQRSSPTIINAVAVNSAAYEAGIKIGDIILAMDGRKLRRLQDIYDLTWYENPPKPYTYTILRDGKKIEITFAARHIEYENKKGVELKHGQTGMVRMSSLSLKKSIRTINGINVKGDIEKARKLVIENFDKIIEVGIPYKGGTQKEVAHPFLVVFPAKFNQHLFDPNSDNYDFVLLDDPDKEMFVVRLSLAEAIGRSVFLLKEGVVNSYKIIEAGFKGKNDDKVVSGVSSMGKKVGSAVKSGFYEYVILLAVFSFMIGIINLLPVPVLDGGYLLFLIYEIIWGKPVPSRVQDIAMMIGLLLLAGIMIYANASDLLSMIFDVPSD